MTTKLYVGNLPREATEQALRAHFSACGGVSDVEILTDRRSGEPKGQAFVTMTSPSFATAAVERLDGTTFGGRPLRVSSAPLREIVNGGVKIAQQFREAKNMAYELDCAGTPLVVRVFPPESDESDEWRIEASTSKAADAPVVAASSRVRTSALGEVAKSWRERADELALPTVDWDAIAISLTAVRGI
jgi:cold-inducible RNA-binding protein